MASNNESRGVIDSDLQVIDEAISSHEAFQTQLYALRRILTQVGKVDARRADLVCGVENEQARLQEAHKRANDAQQQLNQIQKQVEDTQRELREVEALIQERTTAANQLNDAINHLRSMLAAA
jgi:peptidoglycan hydrolase CwlO-like protein